MASPRILPLASFLGLLLLGSNPVSAHDFWIERDSAGFSLQRGHAGGQRLPLDPRKIVTIRCLDPKGKALDALASARFENTRATIQASCTLISAYEDGGYYSLTPDGEKNLPKNQATNAVKAWRSKQFAKWVDSRSPLQTKALGDELEVVPVTDLAKVKAGDKATFRILLQGKPIVGAILAIDHKGIGESDDEGVVRIRIREGRNMTVAATYRRPLKSQEADAEVFEASLTFEVGK